MPENNTSEKLRRKIVYVPLRRLSAIVYTLQFS